MSSSWQVVSRGRQGGREEGRKEEGRYRTRNCSNEPEMGGILRGEMTDVCMDRETDRQTATKPTDRWTIDYTWR